MRAKTISIAAGMLVALTVAGCGDDEPQAAPTVTVALPSSSTTRSASTTTPPPPPAGEPSGPAETATEDPRVNELEREADRTARDYVEGLDARDGEAVCALHAPGALDAVEFPVTRDDCAASLTASIGYRDPRGLPVWEGATAPNIRVSDLDGRSATVVATVVSHFADREDSVEDDVIYLTRDGDGWLIAKPSATLYRAIGIADIPPSVLSPPG
jgi:hypothetical protein